MVWLANVDFKLLWLDNNPALMLPDSHFMIRHSPGIQIARQFPVHITIIYWALMSGNTRCQPIMCGGDHCSDPGTCPRQTAATAQVFSVGRGFLQARSDLGSQHTRSSVPGLGMVDLVWPGPAWQSGPSYLGMHSLAPQVWVSHGLTGWLALLVPGRRKETLETRDTGIMMRTLP